MHNISNLRILIDLDDTLIHTTRDLCGYQHPERLTLVSGALSFLKRYGSVTELLTAGERVWQLEKIKAVGILPFVHYGVKIVPHHTDKHDVIRARAGQYRPLIVIGDRPDAEISYGNMEGAHTIRVKVPGGRHVDVVSSGNFGEAMLTCGDMSEVEECVNEIMRTF